ncbi:MAG: DNA gyrase inhibitor YacG [Alphaproteobacteria bacterium]|nr:MAG: DNA gyrase inhibitor YacG [Alphaproteobacteria bacterium]
METADNNDLCPLCKKNSITAKYHPFCSARCADVDLGRWLKGNYVLPGEKAYILKADET